ncbi:hypothetical protein ACR6C2_23950 [Streptomyces sp. INA 01156]
MDPDKARSWSSYVAYLSAKFDMPVLLVTVCRDRATASWATGPFECAVGPWSTQTTRPFVLGPQTVWFDRSLTATTAEGVLNESPNVPADASEQP